MEAGEQAEEERRPAAAAILSAAVAQAVAQADARRAFDMLLLHEQLLAADAEGRAGREENAALRAALAALKQEQSAMHVYLHGKLDAQVARVAELERSLAAAVGDAEALAREAAERLEREALAHARALEEREQREQQLREELRKVRVFMEQQRELEGETSALHARLAAQEAAAGEREAALERKFLVALDRGKQQLLARTQATKEALVARTAGQLNTTTKRTMMENEQFMEELAFQSRESEALVERLAAAERDARALRVRNQVLEANETALAKKAHYYRRVLGQVRGAAARGGGDGGRRVRGVASDGEDSEEEEEEEEEELEQVAEQQEDKAALQERVAELERKLRRALDWLRVVEADKQLLLARQDEALQFLLAALDEGARQLGGDVRDAGEDARVALAGEDTSVEALVSLFPRPLAPALDELETRALLRFLVEKLRVRQQQAAALQSAHSPAKQQAQSSPKQQQRTRGLELPPIGQHKATSTTSPRKRRAFFAHVSAAVARGEADAVSSSSGGGGVAPELLGLATGQFNLLSPAKGRRSGAASPSPSPCRSSCPSPVKRAASGKAASGTSSRAKEPALAASDSTAELMTPWPTDAAAAEGGA